MILTVQLWISRHVFANARHARASDYHFHGRHA